MSQAEAAYAAILQAVERGDYAPGDRLREEEVGARLDLSRTPVRDAFRRLEAEGIVEHRPRLGAVIRHLSHADIVALFEMRAFFERAAAELAAKHGTAPEFAALEDINRHMADETGNPARAAALNQSFHKGLYLACRNPFLLEAARGLNNAVLLLRPTTLTDAARIEVVIGEHEAILTALKAGDAGAAGDAAAAHLATSLRHRLQGFAA